jgi:hypothetical protein
MAQEISLGDAVCQLALLMKEKGNLTIAFKNEAPWHLLFYRLKKEAKVGRPRFLDRLRFDSDGRYPRCRELSEFLHGLHTACTVDVANPTYEEMILPEDVVADWQEEGKTLDKQSRAFLGEGLKIAKEEFPPKQKVNA